MSGLEYKSVNSGIITDIDEKQGRVLGYFSVFGNVDSDNDMMMPGAYTKTLKENHDRIKHLYQHDVTKPLSGVRNGRLIITEDAKGLAFDSTITQTSYGRDVIKLYADSVIDEHSVGFNTVRKSEKANYTEITEVKLWEGSTVTWGANSMAGTSSIKSLTKEEAMKKMGNVIKALRNGKYENEEVFDLLEIYFKQLESIIKENTTMPVADTTTSPGMFIDAIKLYTQTLN